MEYLREQKNLAQHTSSEATARFSLNACCEFWECKSGVVIFWHITMRPRRECSNIDSHMLVQLLLRVFFGFFLLLQLSAQTFEYKMNIYCKEKRTGRPHSIWTFFFSIFKNEYLFCSPWLLWVECSIYPTSDNKCGPTTIFRWINHCFFLDMERYGRNANREIKCKKLSCVGCLETCQCVKMRKFHILKLSSVNLFWVTKQNANIKFKPAEV